MVLFAKKNDFKSALSGLIECLTTFSPIWSIIDLYESQGIIMTVNRLSDQVLFETKVHCLYLLDQYNKAPNSEDRIRKHDLNNAYKQEIIEADIIDVIKEKLLQFQSEIGTKKEGLLYQKVDDCLRIPSIESLMQPHIERRVIPRQPDEIYSEKLKSCIPLLEYSLSHPEHPIKNLISAIRTADSLDTISSLISDFKQENVKPRGFMGSIFARDSLSQHLDKATDIVNSFKVPGLKNES
jgi:hypothetical protein